MPSPATIFALCAILTLAAGQVLFANLAANQKADHFRNLASIGQLKARQVEAYLNERHSDATVLASLLDAPAWQHWLERPPAQSPLPSGFAKLAGSMASAYKYEGIFLIDRQGQIRFGMPHAGALSGPIHQLALQTMREGRSIHYRIDFGDPSDRDTPLLHTFAPIMSSDRSHAVGLLLLRSPLDFLSILIQTWPTESRTAESVLVAREGNDAVYLTELRYMMNAALRVRLPLSAPIDSPGWPAISAASGHYGTFSSIDYRRHEVLAYTAPLVGVPWGILVKIDTDEALEKTREQRNLFLVVMMFIVSLTGLALWQWSRRIEQERRAAAQLEQAQVSLRTSEAALKEAQRVAHVGSWSHDFATQAVTWSDEVYRIFGLEPGAIEPDSTYFRSRVFPDDLDRLDVELQRALAEKRNFGIEHRLQSENGKLRWVFEHCELIWDADGKATRAVGTLQDITERKLAELSLREANMELSASNRQLVDAQQRLAQSESVLKDAQQVAHVGSWTHDLATGDLAWSDETYRIFGLEPQSRPARNGYYLYHVPPEQRHRVTTILQEAIANGHNFEIEHRLQLDNGQTRWVFLHGNINTGTNGRPTHVIGTLQDITERKLAEARLVDANTELAMRNRQLASIQSQLLESSNALKDAQRIAKIGSWRIGLISDELVWSDEVYRIFGLEPGSRSPDQACYYALLHPDDREAAETKFRQALQTRRGYDIEHRLCLENGETKWVHANFVLTCTADGTPEYAHGTIQDTTERKLAELLLRSANDELKDTNRRLGETQSMLLQNEKLASLGQLAAGVAHEINNPVSYVNSNINSLRRYVADILRIMDAYRNAERAAQPAAALAEAGSLAQRLELDFLAEDIKALIEESSEGLIRVRQIVHDLKSFSHSDQMSRWERFNLHKGLDSTLNIMLNEIKYNAAIIKEYGDLPEIVGIPSKLNQVFMNLMTNASQAMSDIDSQSLRNCPGNTLTLRTGCDTERGIVWIEVIDTGCGIAPENLPRVFDPFFTTKPVGKGTGLGLSLSYGIVKQHHGDISVTSVPGRGTAFRVTLPIEPVGLGAPQNGDTSATAEAQP